MNEREGTPRNWAGSIAAVAAGFGTVFALSLAVDAIFHALGVYPPFGVHMSNGLFALATAQRALATLAGGWVTARLAPARPYLHTSVLAVVGTLAGLGGVVVSMTHPELGPLWYPIAIVALSPPCLFAGAWLRAGRASTA